MPPARRQRQPHHQRYKRPQNARSSSRTSQSNPKPHQPPYTPLSKIGEGGEGPSHLLLNTLTNHVLVCKTLSTFPLAPTSHPLPLEVYILSTILRPHPRILPLLDHHIHLPGVPELQRLWLYTPYCSMGDLRDYVPTPGNFVPEEHIWHIFAQIAEALAYLHHGYIIGTSSLPAHWTPVIHRDIKPGNIFLRPSPSSSLNPFPDIILGDFGLATLEPVTEGCGTAAYLPPEMFNSPAGDIWALGTVIHELGHGTLPLVFPPEDWEGELEEWYLQPRSRCVRELGEGYSRELNEVMMRCLEWDVQGRVGSLELLGLVGGGG